MAANIVVPELGESVIEATVSRWLKQPGDKVAAGEPLVELETEKVNLEVAAERAGVLAHIEHVAGADVKVGDVLGVIEETVGAPAANGTPSPAAQPAETAKPTAVMPDPKAKATSEAEAQPEAPASAGADATPVARRMAAEAGVDLGQ